MYFLKINIKTSKEEQYHLLAGSTDIWTHQLVEKNVWIDQQLGTLAWNKLQWSTIIQDPNLLLINLFMHEELVGLLLATVIEGEELSHLLKLIIDSDHRRQGLASILMKKYQGYLEQIKIRKIYLEVQEDNYQAIRCYEKHGVKKCYLQKRFYSNGENAWKMFAEFK